jgi:hypothetical protein
MPKPPGTLEAETQKIFLNLIVLRNSASFKSLSRASQQPDRTQTEESKEARPALPEHLDKLLDLPWTSENSRQIDLWLWYVQQEFEMTGGAL